MKLEISRNVSDSIQKLTEEMISIQKKIKQRSLEVTNLYNNIQYARKQQFVFWEKYNEKLQYALSQKKLSKTHEMLFLSAQKAVSQLKQRYSVTQLWFDKTFSSPKSLPIIPFVKKSSSLDDLQKSLAIIEDVKTKIMDNLKLLLDEYKKVDLLAHNLVTEYAEDSNLFIVCRTAEEIFINHLEKSSI